MLWQISWQVAILAVLVKIICRFTAKTPAAWKHTLWLLVVIKFFVPPFVSIPAEWTFWSGPEAPRLVKTSTAVGLEGGMAVSSENSGNSLAQPFTDPKPAPTLFTLSNSLDWQGILLNAWILGIGCMGILLLARIRAQRRLVHESEPASAELEQLLAECCISLRVHRVPGLAFSKQVQSPQLIGLLDPLVLLPRNIKETCNETELRAILMHELAHIGRQDMAILWLCELSRILFFFHPAAWAAGRAIARERELACDQLVLSRARLSAREYAEGYISALKLANNTRSVGTLAMAEPFEMEKRRLEMILHNPLPKASLRLALILGAVVVLGIPTIYGSSSEQNSQDITAKREALVAKMEESGAELLCNILRGSCGSTYHSGMRFECMSIDEKPYGVYYLPKSNVYFVVGKALVTDSKRPEYKEVFEDSEIPAPGKPDSAPNSTVSRPENSEVPAELIVKRKDMIAKLEASGAELLCNIPQGSCGTSHHPGIRFAYIGGGTPYGVYFLPKSNSYFVVGKAEMYDSHNPGFRQIVEDGEIDAPDTPGSALVVAARTGNIEAAKSLIQGGADVNARDRNGDMALHNAVQSNNLEMAELLLAHGADINAKEPGDCGWGWYPLHLAARNENIQMVKLLVSHGAKVNAKRTDGWYPIHTAAFHGQPDIIKLLIAHGANIHSLTGDHLTTVYLASAKGKTAAVKLFINHGVKIDARSIVGKTALYEASFQGYADIVQMLISKGADVNARSKEGISPLKAVEMGEEASKEGKISSFLEIGEAARNWTKTRMILLKHGAEI